MSDLSFYVPAALGTAAFLLRLPALLRNPRDPMLRAVVVLLATATGVFFFGAIPTIEAVNRLTGVPNAAAPLVYSILTAFCGACVVLLINWRGGTPEAISRATRWCLAAYGLIIVALLTLFALGDTPVERTRDLDTYYADTPFIREMIVLYLLTHSVSALVMTFLCWRWSRDVTGVLRTGLLLMVYGYLLTVLYDVAKFAALGARWAGEDWDGLSTHAARPLVSAASFFIAFGIGMPLVVQRLEGPRRDWLRYRRLGPLWRLLRGVAQGGGRGRSSPLAGAGIRLLQRERDIHDALLTLNPYFDFAVRARTVARGVAAGIPPPEAEARAEAAMVVAALDAFRADPGHSVIAASRALQEGLGDESRDLVRVSLALHGMLRGEAGPSLFQRAGIRS
ncbi:MAB_1171c family putative transporter [Streptomyces yaizuensis]|uniref:Membrane protein n=1 Tax=Streptomyces yaizuensis TaxID=2989713 RepID=A0ABQ5P125_9ACTN|nr:MAB_1171c family putative transporter [Streptomyces sp. YSPA8]GLF96312.1 membrane protein [Streptomyces sp. YSPA8]